jgi:hypothetical protein
MLDPSFLEASDVSSDVQKSVNAICRSRPHKISFFSSDVRGGFGQIFVDLQEHTYTPFPKPDSTPEPQTDAFVSLEVRPLYVIRDVPFS